MKIIAALITSLIVIFVFFIIVGIIYILMPPLDETDKDFFHRSNLQLHIDNKTGCHYLTSWSGVIYPRLDKDGKHICSGYERNKQ